MAPVDPQYRRRAMRTGLTALHESRACPGYNLYPPYYGSRPVGLIDVHGAEVNQVFRSTDSLPQEIPALG